MGKKFVKCPRCELNYILEGEDYCQVCKSEMKHHSESEEEYFDLDDMDICPVCGQNLVKEGQAMCDECKSKKNSDGKSGADKEDVVSNDWSEKEDDDDSLVSTDADVDESEDDYGTGFSEIDETSPLISDTVKISCFLKLFLSSSFCLKSLTRIVKFSNF